MKKLIFLAAFAAASCASAQNLAVAYDYTHTYLNDGKSPVTDHYTLLSEGARSMFYNPDKWALDSLQSTPEGREAIKQQTLARIMSGQALQPQPKGDYFCKNADGTISSFYDGMDKYRVDEPLGGIDWQLTDSTRVILGYECQQAVGRYHGRQWTAWFAADIAVPEGPWKLCGLPGLILEAAAEGGQYAFRATAIGQTAESIPPIYGRDEFEKIDRDRYWRDKRDYTDHALERLRARTGLIKVHNEDGSEMKTLYVPRDVLDFIETDY